MKIEKVEVKAYRVRVMCDCGGKLRLTGETIQYNGGDGPDEKAYYYQCWECFQSFCSTKKVGSIQYEEVKSDE